MPPAARRAQDGDEGARSRRWGVGGVDAGGGGWVKGTLPGQEIVFSVLAMASADVCTRHWRTPLCCTPAAPLLEVFSGVRWYLQGTAELR